MESIHRGEEQGNCTDAFEDKATAHDDSQGYQERQQQDMVRKSGAKVSILPGTSPPES